MKLFLCSHFSSVGSLIKEEIENKKVTEKIMTEFSDLNLCPINNRQGIVIDGEDSKVICKD